MIGGAMPDLAQWSVFLTASIILLVIPGPSVLFVVARGIDQGFRAAVFSSVGLAVGDMFQVLCAAVGLSTLLASSIALFTTVKYAGAAYLCFMGVRMILDARKDARKQESFSPGDLTAATGVTRNPLWQGVATEVLNPKTALFFLSFIPQFVNRGVGHVFLQFVLLGAMSVVLNTSADLIVILLAGPLGKKIRSSPVFRRRQRTVTGAIMIGLGAYLATSESR